MNKDKLSKLAGIVDGNGISRLDIKTEEFRIKICKRKKQPVYHVPVQSTIQAETPEPCENDNIITIKAERVGSFYSTHMSDTQDSLHSGDIIQKGQPICMIESMGIEYIVKSPEKCVLLETFAKDTQPVEYGEILFKLKVLESEDA